jgi:hypothetical protein
MFISQKIEYLLIIALLTFLSNNLVYQIYHLLILDPRIKFMVVKYIRMAYWILDLFHDIVEKLHVGLASLLHVPRMNWRSCIWIIWFPFVVFWIL